VTATVTNELRAPLEAGLAALRISIPSVEVDRLLAYLSLIDRWNAVHNLTAVRDPLAMLSQHLLDSLAIEHLIVPGATLLDVGTGAGLPGIPLAITRDDLKVTMLDSNGKKTAFVQHAITTLRLENAIAVTSRAERWHTPNGFQVIVSRALSDLARFTTNTRQLLLPGGHWIAMKGQRPSLEIDALPDDIEVLDVRRLDVPMLVGERHAIVMAPRTSTRERSP